MNPTPNSMKGAGSEVMTNEIITSSVDPGYYDCGNELERVVNDGLNREFAAGESKLNLFTKNSQVKKYFVKSR